MGRTVRYKKMRKVKWGFSMHSLKSKRRKFFTTSQKLAHHLPSFSHQSHCTVNWKALIQSHTHHFINTCLQIVFIITVNTIMEFDAPALTWMLLSPHT